MARKKRLVAYQLLTCYNSRGTFGQKSSTHFLSLFDRSSKWNLKQTFCYHLIINVKALCDAADLSCSACAMCPFMVLFPLSFVRHSEKALKALGSTRNHVFVIITVCNSGGNNLLLLKKTCEEWLSNPLGWTQGLQREQIPHVCSWGGNSFTTEITKRLSLIKFASQWQ